METVWYVLLWFMLTVYVVLDGFDFGAGIVHLAVAKENSERRTVLSAIGPLWDGNEVWLVAFGGVLLFSFPRGYAAGFSGFYLPLMLVLWLLIMRGLSIELRSHIDNKLWSAFWDTSFMVASGLLAFVFGVALGNLVRGVPLDDSGHFSLSFFEDFRTVGELGTLDWYTMLVGLFAVVVLGAHGALYLVWKTGGLVAARSRRMAYQFWGMVVPLLVLTTIATGYVWGDLFRNLLARGWTWMFPPLIVGSLIGVFIGLYKRLELPTFLASSLFIASLLGATAAGLYPNLLRSTHAPDFSVTVHNGANTRHGLIIGIVFWVPAILLAIAYFAFLFHSFRGKVEKRGHTY